MQISNFTESKPGLAVLWVNQKQANEEKDLNFERTSDKRRVYWTTLREPVKNVLADFAR